MLTWFSKKKKRKMSRCCLFWPMGRIASHISSASTSLDRLNTSKWKRSQSDFLFQRVRLNVLVSRSASCWLLSLLRGSCKVLTLITLYILTYMFDLYDNYMAVCIWRRSIATSAIIIQRGKPTLTMTVWITSLEQKIWNKRKDLTSFFNAVSCYTPGNGNLQRCKRKPVMGELILTLSIIRVYSVSVRAVMGRGGWLTGEKALGLCCSIENSRWSREYSYDSQRLSSANRLNKCRPNASLLLKSDVDRCWCGSNKGSREITKEIKEKLRLNQMTFKAGTRSFWVVMKQTLYDASIWPTQANENISENAISIQLLEACSVVAVQRCW